MDRRKTDTALAIGPVSAAKPPGLRAFVWGDQQLSRCRSAAGCRFDEVAALPQTVRETVSKQDTASPRWPKHLGTNIFKTDREVQVFELIGVGRSTRQIAATLQVGISTVETYRNRIKRKLHLKGGAELLQCAISSLNGRNVGGAPSVPESQLENSASVLAG